MTNKLKIATRKSPLALWQTHFIKNELSKLYPQLEIELVPLSTEGDEKLSTALHKIGGKGLFLKELEHALLSHKADIAVHSMKDVPVEMADELVIAAVCEREDARDVFCANHVISIQDLPAGATVGTSSLRRQCQLLALRQDLKVKFLRGNVGTRFKKLEQGEYDAIILAAAGVKRLELTNKISSYLDITTFLPGIGQGSIGIECRADDSSVQQLLKPLHHSLSYQCISAERALSKRLDGGCHTPIGSYANICNQRLTLHGLVGKPDGSIIISDSIHGDPEQAETLGIELAERLLKKGADTILANLHNEYKQ